MMKLSFHFSCRCKTKPCSLKLPDDVANFMDGNLSILNHKILTRELIDDEIIFPL